jgi:hypothetical protein
MPGWIRMLAEGNLVNWAVNGARDAMLGQDWSAVWSYAALLTVFTLPASTVA